MFPLEACGYTISIVQVIDCLILHNDGLFMDLKCLMCSFY